MCTAYIHGTKLDVSDHKVSKENWIKKRKQQQQQYRQKMNKNNIRNGFWINRFGRCKYILYYIFLVFSFFFSVNLFILFTILRKKKTDCFLVFSLHSIMCISFFSAACTRRKQFNFKLNKYIKNRIILFVC